MGSGFQQDRKQISRIRWLRAHSGLCVPPHDASRVFWGFDMITIHRKCLVSIAGIHILKKYAGNKACRADDDTDELKKLRLAGDDTDVSLFTRDWSASSVRDWYIHDTKITPSWPVRRFLRSQECDEAICCFAQQAISQWCSPTFFCAAKICEADSFWHGVRLVLDAFACCLGFNSCTSYVYNTHQSGTRSEAIISSKRYSIVLLFCRGSCRIWSNMSLNLGWKSDRLVWDRKRSKFGFRSGRRDLFRVSVCNCKPVSSVFDYIRLSA